MNWDQIEVKWAEMTSRVSGNVRTKAQVGASSKVLDTRQTAAVPDPVFTPSKPVIGE